MTNLDIPSSMQTIHAEKDWEEEYDKDGFLNSPSPSGLKEESPQPDLHFVDTDLDETPQKLRHKSLPPRNKRTSPPEKVSPLSDNNNLGPSQRQREVPPFPTDKNIRYKESFKGASRVASNSTDIDNFIERCHGQIKYSKPMMYEGKHEINSSQPSYMTAASNPSALQRSSAKEVIAEDELSTSFNSTLTFGDTQGLHEKVQDDYAYKQTGVIQNLRSEISGYRSKESDDISGYRSKEPDRSSEVKSNISSDPSETDIMLHNFIRHEPPSNLNSLVNQSVSAPNDLFPVGSPHSYMSQDLNSCQPFMSREVTDSEQHLLNGLSLGNVQAGGIHIPTERDSSSSLSGSPLPNITPYGSFENQISPNFGTPMQTASQSSNLPYSPYPTAPQSSNLPYTPYPIPLGVENNSEGFNPHLQPMRFVNQNLTHPITPTIRNVVPITPQMGLSHYRLPNSNLIIPQYHGQNVQGIQSQFVQQQLQQAQLQQAQFTPGYVQQMLALNALRLQEAQLATGSSESEDNMEKEQGNVTNQPQFNNQQIFAQNQAQLLTQNQPHVMQFQNQPHLLPTQNQQAIPSMDTAMSKQEDLLQTNILQSTMTPGGKTQEEIILQYQQTLQTLNQLTQEMHQVQTPPNNISVGQPQPQQWGVYSANPTMPVGMHQFYPGVAIVPQLPHLIHQSQNTGHISPGIQQTPQNHSGLMNIPPEMDPASEINVGQEQSHMSTELIIGRGRGRIQ